MAEKVALHTLTAGVVLDRSVLVGLSSDEIHSVFEKVRLSGADSKLVVTDNADTYFTAPNLLKLIRAKNTDFFLIAEKAGMVVSGEDVAAILHADEVTAKITAAMVPPYPWVKKPEGWTFASHVSFGPTKVKRRPGTGDTTFALGPKQIEVLWGYASKKWATGKSVVVPSGSYAGYNRRPEVHADRVVIGCQTIWRYELEGIAEHKGWAVPAAA